MQSYKLKEAKNMLSISPNLFPFNNPYQIKFKANEEDTLKLRQTFIAKKTEKNYLFSPQHSMKAIGLPK